MSSAENFTQHAKRRLALLCSGGLDDNPGIIFSNSQHIFWVFATGREKMGEGDMRGDGEGISVMPLGRVSGRRVVFVVGVSGDGDAGCLLLSRLDCSSSGEDAVCE